MEKVLVACEESQIVTKEFRLLGIKAYSSDIKPCSGGHPEWHIQGDVLPLLDLPEWKMIIAFPPCTHLANSGAAWFAAKRADGRQQQGVDFFMRITFARCQYIAIENPVGIMSTIWRKPDQIIQPYEYGDPYTKKTCLWLKNLPRLKPTNIVSAGEKIIFKSGKSMSKWYSDTFRLAPEDRATIRSKTFPGFAKAMAMQWGKMLFHR